MCGGRRQKVSRMTVACLCISAIALILQIVSVTTDYWATFWMRTLSGGDEVRAYKGLWTGCACVAGSCQCAGITSEQLTLNHVLFIGAIAATFLTVLLDMVELCFVSKQGWRVVKFVLSLVSATCIFVGVAHYLSVYQESLIVNHIIIVGGAFKHGWSFILCVVAGATMTAVTIYHIVDICRKRRSGTGLSIRSDDTEALVS